MNIEQLQSQIKALLDIVKISQEEKTNLFSKLSTSTLEQLEALRTNLMQQVVIDIYFDEVEKLENSEYLLDDSDLDEMTNKIITRLEETKNLVFTEAEINQIRQNLVDVQKVPASTTT